MRTVYRLSVPEDANATVTVAASVAEFKALAESLVEVKHKWPACDLFRQIQEVVREASAKFESETTEGERK